jgi:hypothetical protein
MQECAHGKMLIEPCEPCGREPVDIDGDELVCQRGAPAGGGVMDGIAGLAKALGDKTAELAELKAGIREAYVRGLEDAAQIADEWIKYTNCPGHDFDPCCHVRTAAAIAASIREQKG